MGILHKAKHSSAAATHSPRQIKSHPVKVAVGSGSRPTKSKHKIESSGDVMVRHARHVPGALK